MAKQHEEETFGFTYDVFISFRGEDTRNNFIGHLRKELSRKGMKIFFDDRDLPVGNVISPSLSKAIEESKILIIVFSKNYASSTWCLDELVKILEQSKISEMKQLVFPVFYHVDPSDVRKQTESYGEHMTKHEENFGKASQKLQAWRTALFEASNFPGHHITTRSGYEIDFIEKIVEKVQKNIAPKPLYTGQNPVGLGPRVEEVMSLLDMKPYDETVRMLGVWGLGGVGKTELAKALYDNIVQSFDAASFLADVREKLNKINGLEDLQKTLLSEMREELDIELGSAIKGMFEIKRKLKGKKVLLVLDDVDDKDKLEKLAGGRDWFGSGSRIIITTRDKDVLIAHQVDNIYQMEELDKQHSLELFCWNAFKQSHPKTGFEDVSLRAIYVAKGLPLALKVIGSDLATLDEESLEDWKCALEEYERTPPERILDVLKKSYDRLGSKPKQVFLDIACFFKGEKKEYVENILDDIGAITYNINVLVKKSLLTIEDGCLKMHDLIQDMGRVIVRQEEPDNPGERSRLWYYEDVIEILTDDLGSNKIQGIMLDPPQREEVDWSGTAFEKMKRLRILIVRNTSFSSEPEHLPNHLRVLDWIEYPSKSFPSKFYPKKIVVFNFPRSHLTLEEPFKKFPCLTNMDFSYNQSITEVPDVSGVENLRQLRLDQCKNLTTVHESVGFLKKLAHLSASGCTNLRNFLLKMFLPSLKVLDLNLCIMLEHFPDIMKEMKEPLKIYMINTAIKEMPESIGNLTGLVCLDISNSKELKYLPSSVFMLPNVVAFKIGGCSQLKKSFKSLQSPSTANVRPTLRTLHIENGGLLDEDLLAILNCFPKLEVLIASKNNFVSLPACIKECVHLTSLDVSACWKLQKIPECTNLRILNVNGCKGLEQISELPSGIQKVDARYCFSLTRETSDMLCFQAKKGICGLEVVMPMPKKQVVIPEWFDLVGHGGNPHFWARGKFPILSLALLFQDVRTGPIKRYDDLIELQLVINCQCVPRKGYYNFRVPPDHILICDLRLLFSDKEWIGLDAFLDRDWNEVQVAYVAASTMTLSCWGVYVYEGGANKKDVQFECPDAKYSDMSRAVVPTKDTKLERRKMIERYGAGQAFDAISTTLLEVYENVKDLPEYSHLPLKEKLSTILGFYKEVSRQAEAELESGRSDLQDKHSFLTAYLEYEMNVKALEEEEASTSVHQGSKEELLHSMQHEFYDGVTDGLVEARKRFPSLDIIKIRGATLKKRPEGTCVEWLFEVLFHERKAYTEGIVNGLLEAKLSFPELDMWATIHIVLCARGIEGFREGIRPSIQVIDEVEAAPVDVGEASTSGHQGSQKEQGYDPQQQKKIWEIFYYGIVDGLFQAQNSFPYLDVFKTANAAFDKRFAWSPEGNLQVHTLEMRTYTNGIINGLHEAKLSFPDLDIWATLNVVLNRIGIYETPALEFASRILDAINIMEVGEAPTSGLQESDQEEKQEIIRKIECDGMKDGLVEAKKMFPSLDVIKTRAAAFNNGTRVAWLFVLPQVEMKLHIEGIMNGLLEAKLRFPDLDIWTTLNIVLCRRGMEGLHERIRPLIRVMDVGEASTSGHQGSEDEEQGYNAKLQKLMETILYQGMMDALYAAHNNCPSLNIFTTKSAALRASKNLKYLIGVITDDNPALPMVMEIMYINGIMNGLREAKLSFPDLDMWATLTTVLSKIGVCETSILQYASCFLDTNNTKEVGEASTSSHQGSEEEQCCDYSIKE
ncbi:hypothetical protein GYH30_005502 [Glycine max]|nr:hypothetical protein GYH30_005502 [Glycine max]